jgi:ketosteroid isomerase-like protein
LQTHISRLGIDMPDEVQNVAVLTEAYARWADSKGGSADHWMSLIADRIKFGSLAQGGHGAAYLTAYQSRDELAQYFAGLARDWEMIEFVPEHFVAQADRVVMLGRCSWRFKRTGKVVATPKADSWRFADGKAIEFYEYYDTAQLRDATS